MHIVSQTSGSQPTGSSIARPSLALMSDQQLLPGEDPEHYASIRDAIIVDIQPKTTIEWLWTSDLVELSWEILRYRRLRQKVLETSRELGIRSVLEQIDLPGIEESDLLPARQYVKQNAAAWRNDPESAREIERRLLKHKVDVDTVNLEVVVQSRELYQLFESLLCSAQHRRILLLREIESRRSNSRRFAKL
jgi:hypothetical protein